MHNDVSQENRPRDSLNSLTHSQAEREDDEGNHNKHKADDDSPGSWSSQVDGPPYAEALGHKEAGIIVIPVEDTQLPIAASSTGIDVGSSMRRKRRAPFCP